MVVPTETYVGKGLPGDVYVVTHPLTVICDPLDSRSYLGIDAGNTLMQISGTSNAPGVYNTVPYYQFVHAQGICWISRYNRDNRLTLCFRHDN